MGVHKRRAFSLFTRRMFRRIIDCVHVVGPLLRVLCALDKQTCNSETVTIEENDVQKRRNIENTHVMKQ